MNRENLESGKPLELEPIDPETITPEEDEEIARRQKEQPGLSRGEILRQIRLEKENKEE